MRVGVRKGLVCCGLLVAMVGVADANPGDTYQGGANFMAAKRTKAKATPILRAVISIPPDIQEGDVFVVNCRAEAMKNAKGAPAKGVKGTAAAFANQLDVGSRSWQFFGLVGSGIPFTTGKDGSALMTTGPVVAGSWASNPGANDNLSISATFTNTKRVVRTEFGCEIVVGAVARGAAE